MNLIFKIIFYITLFCAFTYSQTIKEARNYYSVGKYNDCLSTLKKLISKDSKNYKYYILGGKARLKLKDYKKAKANFLLAKKYGAPAKEVDRLIKLATPKSSKTTTKVKNSKKVISFNTKSLSTVYSQCEDLIASGDYETAVQLIRSSLKKYSNDAGLFYYGGVIRFEKGQNDMAIINLKKALNRKDKYFKAFYYLGMIYEKQGDVQKAIRNYSTYLTYPLTETEKKSVKEKLSRLTVKKEKNIAKIKKELKPKNAIIELDSLYYIEFRDTTNKVENMAYNVALNLSMQVKYDELISKLTNILVENSGDQLLEEDINWGIVNIFFHINLPKKGLRILNQLIKSFPHSKRIMDYKIAIANIYYLSGDYQKAINYYKNILKLEKSLNGKRDVFVRLILLYENIKSYSKAIKASEQYIDFLNKNGFNIDDVLDAKYKLAQIYLKSFKTSKTKSVLLDILSVNELKYNVTKKSMLKLADLIYKDGNSKEALKYYLMYHDSYISVNKDDENATWDLFQIGNCYRNLEQFDDAITYYQKLKSDYPKDDSWVKAAIWKLDDTIWQKSFKEQVKK